MTEKRGTETDEGRDSETETRSSLDSEIQTTEKQSRAKNGRVETDSQRDSKMKGFSDTGIHSTRKEKSEVYTPSVRKGSDNGSHREQRARKRITDTHPTARGSSVEARFHREHKVRNGETILPPTTRPWTPNSGSDVMLMRPGVGNDVQLSARLYQKPTGKLQKIAGVSPSRPFIMDNDGHMFAPVQDFIHPSGCSASSYTASEDDIVSRSLDLSSHSTGETVSEV